MSRRIGTGRLVAPRDREVQLTAGSLELRLSRSEAELHAAQALRYDVFYRERGAKPSPEMAALGRDIDLFDAGCDHLVVIDHAAEAEGGEPKIVGTYRLLRRDDAAKLGRFYTQDEYSIRRLLRGGHQVLELGRSCVAVEYRKQMTMNLLWRGIALYAHTHNVSLMFGCASFQGTDPAAIAVELSYLRHYHMAPLRMRPKARRKRYINMNTVPPGSYDPKAARAALPPLIKGYLRMGGMIGDGAVIDYQFNTIDVCIVVRPDKLTRAFARQLDIEGQDRRRLS
ncbi:MAG: GNAT family N-acetyltransferase [Alphaproteobacteria bacterium]